MSRAFHVSCYIVVTLRPIAQCPQEIFNASEETTYNFLTGTLGLSDSMVSRFFAPFYQVGLGCYVTGHFAALSSLP